MDLLLKSHLKRPKLTLECVNHFDEPSESAQMRKTGAMTDAEWSDRDLLYAINHGQTEFFGVLQRRHSDWVCKEAKRLAFWQLQQCDQFDIAQGVWLKIWIWVKRERPHPHDDFRDFVGYLRKCVRSETVSAWRSLKTYRKHVGELNPEFDTGSIEDHSADATRSNAETDSDTEQTFQRLLAPLDDRCALIVRLYYIERLTLEEISVLPKVGLSIAHVWRLLQQAYLRIRETLENMDNQ